MAEPPPVEVQGHGTLAAFHDGCRCGWCESRCWERGCICPTCVELRATSPYFVLPDEVIAAWRRDGRAIR